MSIGPTAYLSIHAVAHDTDMQSTGPRREFGQDTLKRKRLLWKIIVHARRRKIAARGIVKICKEDLAAACRDVMQLLAADQIVQSGYVSVLGNYAVAIGSPPKLLELSIVNALAWFTMFKFAAVDQES